MEWIKKISLLMGLALIGLASCEYEPIVEPEVEVPTEVSFSVDVEPIFSAQSCTNCHNGSRKPDLRAGNAYNSILSDGNYVNTCDPESSLIYTKPAPAGDHPKKYTTAQAAIVLKWITDGANND